MNRLLGTLLVLALASTAATQDYGSWHLTSKFDPITDENQSLLAAGGFLHEATTLADLVLEATDPDAAAYFKGTLVVRCSNDSFHPTGLEPYFITRGKDLGDKTAYEFTYRVDKREPITTQGNPSTDHKAVFFLQADIPDLLRELMVGSELVFRVTAVDPYEVLTYTGPIDGFNDGLAALGCYKGPAITLPDGGPQ